MRSVCPDTRDGDVAFRVTHMKDRIREHAYAKLERTQQAPKCESCGDVSARLGMVDMVGYYRR